MKRVTCSVADDCMRSECLFKDLIISPETVETVETITSIFLTTIRTKWSPHIQREAGSNCSASIVLKSEEAGGAILDMRNVGYSVFGQGIMASDLTKKWDDTRRWIDGYLSPTPSHPRLPTCFTWESAIVFAMVIQTGGNPRLTEFRNAMIPSIWAYVLSDPMGALFTHEAFKRLMWVDVVEQQQKGEA